MKKIFSIILSMMILSSMCLISGSVFAGQSVNPVNVKSETELFQKISEGYTGTNFIAKDSEINTLQVIINQPQWVFVNATSKPSDTDDWDTINLSLSASSGSNVFAKNDASSYSGSSASTNVMYKLPKGVYNISVKSSGWKGSSTYDTNVYVGLLPANTVFYKVSYAGNVSNKGQSFKLKFDCMEMPDKMYYELTNNNSYCDYFNIHIAGEQFKLKDDNTATFSMKSPDDSWFQFAYVDIYGIEHAEGFKILNPYSTKMGTKEDRFTGVVNKYYTGKAIKQSGMSAKVSLGEATSYVASYKNNINIGTATVTLTGTGDTLGTVSKTFKISLKPSSVKKIKSKKKSMNVTVNKGQSNNGYQIQYSLKKNFKGAKTVKISGKNTSKTIKKLKKGKKYYVRVRTYTKQSNGKLVYSTWSKAKLSSKIK